ncbi:uncharacterized protein LOC120217670 [Hibiscus syriacus]|uniref:uncharacterized protein LOC120217670 n=1 Tax=Hibiscus syriacus TaxID=106335 RepID=UPI00192204CB|nr:uncharacterized protein LOC120217670 [Hibiscus syriacus]
MINFKRHPTISQTLPSAMAAQNHETSNGWPLGLQIMSTKIRLQSSNLSSTSFSSVSSSNLDTESPASFFQDNSVSLGKLIGFRQRERGTTVTYFQNTIRAEQRDWQPPAVSSDCEAVSGGDLCRLGICIPVMVGSFVKYSRRSK